MLPGSDRRVRGVKVKMLELLLEAVQIRHCSYGEKPRAVQI